MLNIINERVMEFPHAELKKDSAEKRSLSSVGKCKTTSLLSPLVNSQLPAAMKVH